MARILEFTLNGRRRVDSKIPDSLEGPKVCRNTSGQARWVDLRVLFLPLCLPHTLKV